MARRTSLQSKLFRLQLATMLVFVAVALVFSWRMNVMDRALESRFDLARKIEVLRHADDILEAAQAGRGSEAGGARDRMRAQAQGIVEPNGRITALMHAAEKALTDGAVSRNAILAVRGEIRAATHDLEEAVDAAEAVYREQRLWVAVAWTAILVLPAALAFFPLKLSAGVIDGIRKLHAKVRLGKEGGQSRAVAIARDDEIGELGAAIDEMFAELWRREQEANIARQFRSEQQKLSDIISLTGGIAHEVANPLAVILANLDLVDGTGNADAELANIRDGLERIQALLREVTAFSSGDDMIDAIDVNGVVASVHRIVGLDDRMRSAQLSLALDPALPAVPFSRAALTLSLFSLISLGGAILREARGSLTVSTLLEPDAITIGISAHRADHPPADDDALALALLEGDEASTLNSMNRVLRGFGCELIVLTMNEGMRDYRLRIPHHQLERAA